MHVTPKAQAMKEKIDKLGLIEIENLCIRGHCQQNKRQLTGWETISANYVSDKGLIFRT